MRTTLDLPEKLIEDAMALTHSRTKTAVITLALQNLVQKEKIKKLKKFYNTIDLEIDLDQLRDR